MLVYFASYVTRINFAAILQEVITDTGFAKTSLALILVFQSVAYATGQLVSGKLGDKIKPTELIFWGLAIASAINIFFPFVSFSVPLMAIFWTVNGFAQAMMWPPIVKILVANMDDGAYGTAVVRVSYGSALGTVLVYLAAPLVIAFFGWRGVFAASSAVGIFVCVLWWTIKGRIAVDTVQASLGEPLEKGKKQKNAFPTAAIFPFVFIVVAILCQGMLRDGISSWMPTYLAEVFEMDNKISILCTVSLAVFTIICNTVTNAVFKRFFKNEVFCAGAIFSISMLCTILLLVFFGASGAFTVFVMALISGCMHGINLMLIAIVPKRFGRYGNVSTVVGLVNAFTYAGSAIATYGIAWISEIVGWRGTVAVWGIIALLGMLCCFVATKPWKKFAE